MANEHGSTGFRDANGRDWTPQFYGHVIVDADRELGLTLQDIVRLNIRPGQLLELLWFTCAEQASKRNVSRDDFLRSLGLAEMRKAGEAMLNQLRAAFPEIETELKETGGPFASGGPGTLSSSPPSPESVTGNT